MLFTNSNRISTQFDHFWRENVNFFTNFNQIMARFSINLTNLWPENVDLTNFSPIQIEFRLNLTISSVKMSLFDQFWSDRIGQCHGIHQESLKNPE